MKLINSYDLAQNKLINNFTFFKPCINWFKNLLNMKQLKYQKLILFEK